MFSVMLFSKHQGFSRFSPINSRISIETNTQVKTLLHKMKASNIIL